MAEGGVKDKAGDLVSKAKRRVGVENPSAAEDDGNVGIVRGALRAFGEGDIDGFLDTLKEDVTWEAPGGCFPGGEKLSGRDEVKEKFVGDAGRTFTEFGFRPETFLDAEDENAVVVIGQFEGEGAEGGAVDVGAVQIWQLKGNEAEIVRIYTDSAEFPEVVTEEREKEWEEEEKEKEQKEQEEPSGESSEDEDEESGDDEDSEDDSDDQPKGEKKDDSESKSEKDDDESDDDSGSSDKKDEDSGS